MWFWLKRRQRDALPSRLGRARAQRRHSQQRASLNTRPKARPRPATSTGKTVNRVTWQDQIGEGESLARTVEFAAAPVATGRAYIPTWFPDLPPGYENDQKWWAGEIRGRLTCNGIPHDSALVKKLHTFARLAHWKARVAERELTATKASDAEDRAAEARTRTAEARANVVVTDAAAEKAEENLTKRKQAQEDAERDFIAFLDTIPEEPSFRDKLRTEMLRNRCIVAASGLVLATSNLEKARSDHSAAQRAVNDTKAETDTAARVLDAVKQVAAGAARAAMDAAAAAGITDTSGASSADIIPAIIQAKAAVDQHIDTLALN